MLTLKVDKLPTDCPTHRGLISWCAYREPIVEALSPFSARARKNCLPDGFMSYEDAEDVVRFVHYFLTVVMPHGPIGAVGPRLVRTLYGDIEQEWFVEIETVQSELGRELGHRYSPDFSWFGSASDAVLWATLECARWGIDKVSWLNDIAAQILGDMSSGDRGCCHHKVPKIYRKDMTPKHQIGRASCRERV